MTTTFDLIVRNVHAVTLDAPSGYGLVRDAALGVVGPNLVYVGRERDLPRDSSARETLDGAGRLATPGLVDCHTHLVYAGNRAGEFERRLLGVTYEEIAREGGGIASTVHATRAATDDELAAQSEPRMRALASEGATTVEVKSGYGLATAHELRQLSVARRLGTALDVDVRTTLLAAHALPPEFAGRADDYIDYVCRDTLPAAARSGLTDAVDAFCETIGFTPAQTRRVFETARALRLPVKLHADQLSDLGGAALAAGFDALSADHLEYTSEEGVRALAASGSVAVLLPGAFYALRETRPPPVARLRELGVPIAIATDCNPGTSPLLSLPLAMNMACTLFRLTPEEALRGATVNGARALGLADRGRLAAGLRADIALWDVVEPAELAYRIGGNACAEVVHGGRVRRRM
jgi:imidazolonepropionase